MYLAVLVAKSVHILSTEPIYPTTRCNTSENQFELIIMSRRDRAHFTRVTCLKLGLRTSPYVIQSIIQKIVRSPDEITHYKKYRLNIIPRL